MRRISIILICLAFTLQAGAWGRIGHKTVAALAERHLTPAAKDHIAKYLKGESLQEVSLWMDQVSKTEPYKSETRGWHATVATPEGISTREVREQYRKGRDGVTAMEDFRTILKDYRNMEDSVVLFYIKCIVHIVGDFHCPVHVRYTDVKNEGHQPVLFMGKNTTLHKVWDSGILGRKYKGLAPDQIAQKLDTFSPEEISEATQGWAQEWFEGAAKRIRPMISDVKDDDELDMDFVEKNIDTANRELQMAGYQLAKALNTFFSE